MRESATPEDFKAFQLSELQLDVKALAAQVHVRTLVVAPRNLIRADGDTKGARTFSGVADEFEVSAVSWTVVMEFSATLH